jgi:hypothetical protein
MHRLLIALGSALALSACAIGLGAEAGLSVDTKGRIGVGARATIRSGWWKDRGDRSEDVYYFLPQLIAGAAWEVSTSSLRIDAGIPSLGWARYTAGAWQPSAELVLPMISVTTHGRRIADVRACVGVHSRYAKTVGYVRHPSDAAIERTFHAVGGASEVDLCGSKPGGVFGGLFVGGGDEYLLLQP